MKSNVIEIMKAFGIMGIVVLHAVFIQNNGDNEVSTILRLISIKTLLLLSGFVIYGKIHQKGWVVEKIVRRLPLFIIFAGIYFLFGTYIAGVDGGDKISISFGNYLAYNIMTGFDGLILWYIWTLILCYVVLWLFEKYQAKLKLPYLLKLLLVVSVIVVLPIDALGFKFLRWYGLFLFAGYALKYALVKYPKFLKYGRNLVFSCLALFPLSVWWAFNFVNFKGTWTGGGFVSIVNSISNGEGKYAFIYIMVALLGAGFIYSISKLISRIKYLSKAMVQIGGATIGILVMHKMFLEVKWFDNYWIASIVTIACSMTIYLLLKRIPIVNYALFGGTNIPIKITEKLEGWYGKV